ncbi:ABC-2 type transport system ATP-binding protein [Lactobacillus colini]|uniref:ABC-2 type transport system ATP-binding protein n=1 Tax=Lactobacillus colini TaxID=1819254 RepID=A0ABS4MCU3_9LACO|nr:ATP-binding cassette domain-containing protein [Lactobacillus colini]MBP2057510.1 ABC-2 type transport system ATP-binding protein [Lactobacillus colini]
MKNNIIEVSNLNKVFKKQTKSSNLISYLKTLILPEYTYFQAVKDLNFQIPEGQIFGFIGANGAGKSTTIKMLTGILQPTSGNIVIDGYNPQNDRKEYVKEIGVVFGQRTQLWWDLPVIETYFVLKEIYQIPDSEFNDRLAFFDDILELRKFINNPVRTLSLGQRMRADIAASLLHNPKILFLDEPTIGLDVSVKDRIRQAIKEINSQKKTTIILTTHDLRDVEVLCDRIYIINNGQEIFDGTLEKLKSSYGSMREVVFSVDHINDIEKLNYKLKFPEIEVYVKDNDIHVIFDSNKTVLPELIKYTLDKVVVKNILVNETSIEDIVKKIMRT